MLEKLKAQQSVCRAIDRVNEMLLEEVCVPKADDTILLGAGARLDSMGFVNFVVALEEELAAGGGPQLNLVEVLNSNGIASGKSTTVGDLVEFLSRLDPA